MKEELARKKQEFNPRKAAFLVRLFKKDSKKNAGNKTTVIGTWAEMKNGHNTQLVTDALVVRLFGVESSEYVGLRVKIIP